LALSCAGAIAVGLLVAAEGWPLGTRPVDAAAHPAGWRPWSIKLNESYRMASGPTGNPALLYLTSSDGLKAVDARSGRVAWAFDGAARQDLYVGRDGLYADQHVVYVAGAEYIYALSASTGVLLWERQLVSGPGADAMAVAAGDGGVFAETPQGIFRLDPATGATRWRWQAPDKCGLMPAQAFVEASGTVLALCGSTNPHTTTLEVLDAGRGLTRWTKGLADVGVPSISVSGSKVFYTGPGADDINANTPTALNLSNGDVLWQHYVDNYTVLDVLGNRLWQWDGQGHLSLLDPTSGKTTQTLAAPRSATRPGGDSVLAASDHLVVLNEDSTIRAYRLPDGAQAWHYHVGGMAAQLNGNALFLLGGDSFTVLDAVNGAGPCNLLFCPGQLW
jgi:outer membrane protein assembly factor BamB